MLGNTTKVLRILADTFRKYTLCAFYRTFSNFVSTVTRLDYRDFVDNVRSTFVTVRIEITRYLVEFCKSV